MSNQEKIEALKSWLTENKVKYQEDVVHAGKGIHIDLYLPKYLIAVHVGDDSEFFQEVKNYLHPVFVRDQDSVEFLIEKVQNTIKSHQEQIKRGQDKPKADLATLPNWIQKYNRHRRKKRRKFLEALTPATQVIAPSAEAMPPVIEQKPKRQRVRITTPVKVGSSHL